MARTKKRKPPGTVAFGGAPFGREVKISREPKHCGLHADRKAIYKVRGRGYCWECRATAVAEARKS